MAFDPLHGSGGAKSPGGPTPTKGLRNQKVGGRSFEATEFDVVRLLAGLQDFRSVKPVRDDIKRIDKQI